MELITDISARLIDRSFQEHEILYGFRFIKNGKTLEIFTPNYNQYKKWKNLLIYKTIQSTFHDEFEVTKMIGKGSFAKVYLATKKETGIQYAIKAFNQEFMKN